MKIGEELLFLSDKDSEACISIKEAIRVIEESFRELGKGKATDFKHYFSAGETGAFTILLYSNLKYKGRLGTRLSAVFPENRTKHGIPTVQGIHILQDGQTGAPIFVLCGTSWYVNLRASGTTAVAARCLAKKDSRVVGIIGAGVQGRAHLLALNEIFKLEEIRVFDKRKDVLKRLSEEMSEKLKLEVIPVDTVNKAMAGADVVVTTTTANEPLVRKGWWEPGMFIAKIGSYQELEPEVITTADKVVVDWFEYISRQGRTREITNLLEKGILTRQSIYAELSEIVARKKLGRETDYEKILFVAVGPATSMAGITNHIFERAMELGLGKILKI